MDPLKTFRLESGKTIGQIGMEQAKSALETMGGALYKEGLGIMAESQGLVPVDTSALRSSDYVTEPEYEMGAVTVYFGYGGPAAQINPKTGESTDSYAIYVHENLDAFHKVGSAKFLQMPFDQATEGMAQRVGAEMKAGGGGDFDLSGVSEGEA